MTNGASTAGSTLPTDANICCKNIAPRRSAYGTSQYLVAESSVLDRHCLRARERVDRTANHLAPACGERSGSARQKRRSRVRANLSPAGELPCGRQERPHRLLRQEPGDVVVLGVILRRLFLLPGGAQPDIARHQLRSCRDMTGFARTVGAAIGTDDKRDRTLQHNQPVIKLVRARSKMHVGFDFALALQVAFKLGSVHRHLPFSRCGTIRRPAARWVN